MATKKDENYLEILDLNSEEETARSANVRASRLQAELGIAIRNLIRQHASYADLQTAIASDDKEAIERLGRPISQELRELCDMAIAKATGVQSVTSHSERQEHRSIVDKDGIHL